MAFIDRILSPSKKLRTESVEAATALDTLVEVGERKIFAVSVSDAAYLKWGTSSMTAAAATDMLLPAAGIYTFSSGTFTHISVFNNTAATIVVSVTSMFNA